MFPEELSYWSDLSFVFIFIGLRGWHHFQREFKKETYTTRKPIRVKGRWSNKSRQMWIHFASFLPPANEVCEGYVFTSVCHSVQRGGGHVWRGGGVHAGETATEAGGTHPTGMHSCCFCSLKPNNLTCQLHWCLTKSFCKVISLNYPYVSAFLLDSSSLFTEKLKCFSVISSSLKIMI